MSVCAQKPIQSDSIFERRIAVDFRINSWEIDSAYSCNAGNLVELRELLSEVRANQLMELDSIEVTGYASPDGPLPKNKELSLRRAFTLNKYLRENCGVADSLIRYGESMVPWERFRDIISATDHPWRNDALRILAMGSDDNAVDNTRRMNRLKRLANGDAWRVVKRDVLPQLRSAFVVTTAVSLSRQEPAVAEAKDAEESVATANRGGVKRLCFS